MAVETGQAITTAIRARLKADTGVGGLVTTLGGTLRTYRTKAPQNPPFPYLVYRFEVKGIFVDTHTYLLDLWDFNDSPTRIDSAVDRLKILLHEWQPITGDSEVVGSLMEWFSGGDIPTDAENVWHYATMWSVRFGAARDITNIIGA